MIARGGYGFGDRADALLGSAEPPTPAAVPGDHRAGRLAFIHFGCTACHPLLDLRREEQADLVRLSERAVQSGSSNGRIAGAARHRVGQYQAAIGAFDAAEATFPRRAWDWLFLAMAQHRLGRHDEAEKSLAKALASMDEKAVAAATAASPATAAAVIAQTVAAVAPAVAAANPGAAAAATAAGAVASALSAALAKPLGS